MAMPMHTPAKINYADKEKFYKELKSEAEGILEKEWFVNLANLSALLNQHLPQINWVGFYLNHKEELLLSSFQGLPACTRIKMGKGVCGTSAQQKKSLLVPNVDEFPGHIVCDSNSKSELVIPIIMNDKVLGVLDIDAPVLNRFDEVDQKHLEEIVKTLIQKTEWPDSFT
ncbi:GAF domain-containing protein [Bdellovibrio reynosensis]|uniref:GAF domain-containing protein n=2 Tax=Bdellovibrio reynosensis TaxID=2835041 RepID=A0ABY4C7I3_9BACT|nr:GAF domain-containing protein [Bdellovibrio reynosensis]UOF00754.1 GAF domain-containing protein [Bdellovibrio reynosensis]